MSDETSDLVRAHFRLEMAPTALTAQDVDTLGTVRLGLGIRAAVAYELARAAKLVKPNHASRQRTKR